MPILLTTTAAPTSPIPVDPTALVLVPARAMPLIMASHHTLPPILNDAHNPAHKLVVEQAKAYGIDCIAKKGYFLAPGTSCKSYVYCKPTGAIYSFTCPGEYVYNAEKGTFDSWGCCSWLNHADLAEICDWPENVLCLTASSHTIPQTPRRRWRRRTRRSLSVSAKTTVPDFVCPFGEGYFSDISNNCLR